jgi:hypothetical protein
LRATEHDTVRSRQLQNRTVRLSQNVGMELALFII